MEDSAKKILVADDEPDILEIISYNLRKEGYEVFTASDGNEALDKARLHHPDLIILDIMMPKKTGVEVCQILRTQPEFSQTLIIFLTAVSDEAVQIKGLESGADDYVTKPVSPKVLISRVNAIFRRIKQETVENKRIRIGNFSIDPASYLVTIDEREVVLAKKELPRLDYYSGGFGYRIPPVGAIIENGKVFANIQQPGFTIRYTTDGSEPTINSEIYKNPIAEKGKITLCAFSSNGRKGKLTVIENK